MNSRRLSLRDPIPGKCLRKSMTFSTVDSIMESQIASSLLSIGAVFLRPEEPFTWASGIKSPIYCDNRLTLSAPRVREQVENGLALLV